MSEASGATAGRKRRLGDVIALSVHGPAGVLDLQVPRASSGAELASEYSRQASLPFRPLLYTRLGTPIPDERTLAEVGVAAGAVLVAAGGPAPQPRPEAEAVPHERFVRLSAGALSALWMTVAAVIGVVAGGVAAVLPASSSLRAAALVLLVLAALAGAVPRGPLMVQRALAAPSFAAAAAFAVTWDPAPELLPTILGVAALVGALAAAFVRAVVPGVEEGLRVWLVVGVALFVLTTTAALAGVAAQVVWAVLLLAAMLAARFVPQAAIDVPEAFLIDLERLAVSAWSARSVPTRRRGRTVVPRQAVEVVALRGTRLVVAAAVAVAVLAPVSAVLLLREARVGVDASGARAMVAFAGAALLLAARSYRHPSARTLLRVAGLGCWAALAVAVLDAASAGLAAGLAVGSIGLGLLLVLVAVALGRGWRSGWWSRRAEVAEGLAGALALAAIVPASGLFAALWEMTG